ncbi:chromosome partitioning protein ParA [Roseobacter cerasinus]|uniref:Chromosome partitioning protein ParA n=1 Tax=Roseobacter cerasinus TaxID=2602289 RepID=A0A640VVW9_9RHOB|nr:ParA family protein [Roseobacter cerasinus]GFE52568.1 chromosome partitioning protein ParA [Roseobacter cerasinus]
MPVIAFANSKGGSGKTTSALLLACALAETKPTTIIDADPRHPISTWAKMPGKPEELSVVTNQSEKTILDEIEAAATKDPFVIIDLEGTASRLMSYAISQADLVIIPLKEQQQDALAALDVIQEIHRDMKATRRKIPYAALFTQSRAAVKSRTARHIAAQFRDNPKIDTFDVEIHERDAFAAIFSIGGAVSQLDPKKVNGLRKALENVEGFRSEVIYKLRGLTSEVEGRAVA